MLAKTSSRKTGYARRRKSDTQSVNKGSCKRKKEKSERLKSGQTTMGVGKMDGGSNLPLKRSSNPIQQASKHWIQRGPSLFPSSFPKEPPSEGESLTMGREQPSRGLCSVSSLPLCFSLCLCYPLSLKPDSKMNNGQLLRASRPPFRITASPLDARIQKWRLRFLPRLT